MAFRRFRASIRWLRYDVDISAMSFAWLILHFLSPPPYFSQQAFSPKMLWNSFSFSHGAIHSSSSFLFRFSIFRYFDMNDSNSQMILQFSPRLVS